MSNSESQPQEFHGSVQIQPETDRATEAGQRLRRALDELGGAVLDSGQAREPGAEQDRAALWEAWEAIDRVIGEWLSTKFALARAGFALSRPDQIGIEWVGHQALDEAQHLHLSGYPYSLTPKILDVLAATQPSADTVQAPDVALAAAERRELAALRKAARTIAIARKNHDITTHTGIAAAAVGDLVRALLGTDTPEAGQ